MATLDEMSRGHMTPHTAVHGSANDFHTAVKCRMSSFLQIKCAVICTVIQHFRLEQRIAKKCSEMQLDVAHDTVILQK